MTKSKGQNYLFHELESASQMRAIQDNRNINCVGNGWTLGIDRKWHEFLKGKGILVVSFYYRGFYKKGDGACFDAEIDIKQFMKSHPVKEMIRCKIDVMFIHQVLHERIAYLDRPKYRIVRSGNSFKDMDVKWRDPTGTFWLDTLRGLENYIMAKACIYADRYYADLKKEYDKLIAIKAVEKTLIERKVKFFHDGRAIIWGVPHADRALSWSRRGVIKT